MTNEELQEWDENYDGQLMVLTRPELVERMRYDADFNLVNANNHDEARALHGLANQIESLPGHPGVKIGWFGWTIGDLGATRQCTLSEADGDGQTRPSAIVRSPATLEHEIAYEMSTVELLTVAASRIDKLRREISGQIADHTIDADAGGWINRELSLAITHAEDAITRTNKAIYRRAGVFAITDAERTATREGG